eukprot:5729716-Prymnesium_polylepis.1
MAAQAAGVQLALVEHDGRRAGRERLVALVASRAKLLDPTVPAVWLVGVRDKGLCDGRIARSAGEVVRMPRSAERLDERALQRLPARGTRHRRPLLLLPLRGCAVLRTRLRLARRRRLSAGSSGRGRLSRRRRHLRCRARECAAC